MRQTFKQFEESVNKDKAEARLLLRNTSLNREFHQAVINGEVYSGFWDKESIIKMKTYGRSNARG